LLAFARASALAGDPTVLGWFLGKTSCVQLEEFVGSLQAATTRMPSAKLLWFLPGIVGSKTPRRTF
jgi:hypothetical protein